jgi:hypothetical protein
MVKISAIQLMLRRLAPSHDVPEFQYGLAAKTPVLANYHWKNFPVRRLLENGDKTAARRERER